jgi:hypothetical protein
MPLLGASVPQCVVIRGWHPPEAIPRPPGGPGAACNTRNADRCGAAPWARGTADRGPWSGPSTRRACAVSRCVFSNGDVLDSASLSISSGSWLQPSGFRPTRSNNRCSSPQWLRWSRLSGPESEARSPEPCRTKIRVSVLSVRRASGLPIPAHSRRRRNSGSCRTASTGPCSPPGTTASSAAPGRTALATTR